MAWGAPQYVYFMRPVGQRGPIKIGCSAAPENRLMQLAEWSPYPLELIAVTPGDYRLEAKFHAHFGPDYSHHEWFAWSHELEDTIALVAANRFDFETLRPAAVPFKTRMGRTVGSLLCAFTQYSADFPPASNVMAAADAVYGGRFKQLPPADCAAAVSALTNYRDACRAARKAAQRTPHGQAA